MGHWLGTAVIAAVAGIPVVAGAAQTCAASASAIQSALTVGSNNGEDDTIRIVAGTYTLSTGLTFSSTEAHALTLSGGWNAGCTQQSFADTALDGNGAVVILDVLNANGSISIERLTFESGKASSFGDSAVILQSNTQTIFVDLNQFIGNHALGGTGALSAYAAGGGLYVRNNLFVGNHGAIVGGASVSVGANDGFVTGNTFVANITDAADTAGGLSLGGTGYFVVSNNIIWNNTSAANTQDFVGLSAHARYSNDIGVVGSGTAPDVVSGELYVDPQFAPCGGFLCFNFELAFGSPLINAGVDAPNGGATATDLAGKPRQIGAHVDIGAYENDVIFANGFQ